MNNTYLKFATLSMLVAVSLGALGAHYFKTKLSPEQLSSFETGVRYQIYHSLAILIFALHYSKFSSRINSVLLLFVIGICCFSGSIYLLALRDLLGISSWSVILGPITPLGGIILLSGWLFVLFSIPKSIKQ